MTALVTAPDLGAPQRAVAVSAPTTVRPAVVSPWTSSVVADLVPPDDVYDLDDIYDADDPRPPRYLAEEDLYDELPPMSRIDALEWELWAGVEQDEAEREMLRSKAPAWVFLPPGAELAAALEELRPQTESPVALIEAIKAATRLEAWAASIRTAAQASFVRQRKAQLAEVPRPAQVDTSGRPIDPERSWAAEIGAALHLSPQTAARHIDTALHLTGTLAATHTALRCGALTFSKALAISEATRTLPPDTARAVEAHVLRRAPGQTHKNLAASLRRQVAKHTIREDTDRHRAAAAERTCKIVPLSDGMAGLWVVHTADKIQQIWIAVQAMADLAKRGTPVADEAAGLTGPVEATVGSDDMTGSRVPGAAGTGAAAPPEVGAASNAGVKHERTAEQRRADVVADLFEHMLHNGLDWLGRRLPDQHRRRPHIEVLIPANTLLGLDDDPCELAGYGPIPADMARRIAADGTWRRLLTDPTNGTVLEASTTRHDPSALVSETLLARHPVCAWPGCNRTSRECDRDHATPFAQTGRTNLTGLVPYCEYHHVIKDTKAWGWTTTIHPDGSAILTAPTGHRYTTIPPARGPITHGAGDQPAQHHSAKQRSATGQPPPAASPTRKPSADPPPF
ncbi:DUF222 domain-containing protein [Kribbella sp. HUAS MG21]|uniref:DUF222 domain-containing protein n=1 Tax=Kribbella sp. HUAS MG21 TaxID=3160966 RepID=A0AAU7TC41_9ACTN